MGIASEFKEFAMKGNVVDLAVGVIIGAAFGKIVSSLVGDVIMPALGKVIGGVNFSDLAVSLGADPAGKAVLIKYGAFIQTIFDFAHHRDRSVHVHQGHQQAQETCTGGCAAAPTAAQIRIAPRGDSRLAGKARLKRRRFAVGFCADGKRVRERRALYFHSSLKDASCLPIATFALSCRSPRCERLGR